jgi:hypothetical protein
MFDINLSVLTEECIKPSKSSEELSKKWGVDMSEIEKALDKGEKVEIEHTKNKETARIIAAHHIDEMLDYYDKLAKMEN